MKSAISGSGKIAAIYSRTATDPAESTDALEAQRAMCWDAATSAGHQVIAEFRDIGSGRGIDRLGLRHMMTALDKREVDYLIVTNIDRLSRDAPQTAVLKRWIN